MKKLVYIIMALLFISCANNKNETPVKAVESVEMKQDEMTVLESTATEAMEEEFTYQHITKQKLQDYVDLLILQQQHPEFKEDITVQLQELSNNTIPLTYSKQKVTIERVQQIGEIQRVSDSIQKMKVRFDIVTNTSVKSDSMTAIIKTKKINLDGEELISTKITFQRIE